MNINIKTQGKDQDMSFMLLCRYFITSAGHSHCKLNTFLLSLYCYCKLGRVKSIYSNFLAPVTSFKDPQFWLGCETCSFSLYWWLRLLPCIQKFSSMLHSNHLLYFKTCQTSKLLPFIDFFIQVLEFFLEGFDNYSSLGLEGWCQKSIFDRKQLLV